MIEYFEEFARMFTQPRTAVAQILGFIPLILGFFVFYFRDRRKIIATKAGCDAMAASQYLLLFQWTGAAVCSVNVLRGIVFGQRGRRKWADSPVLPVIFLVLTVGSSLLTWTGPESLLPMFGSCLALLGYWCTDTGRLRKLNFAGITLWTIYSLITMTVFSVINNIVYLTSIIRTEIAVYKEKRK